LGSLVIVGCRVVPPTVTDVDHNVYPTVALGSQVWMAANLRSTRGPDGTALFSHLPNDDSTMVPDYGRLYDWASAQHACMNGWHLPSDGEWALLAAHLGAAAGGALKDRGFWAPPSTGATNASGFGARPAGYWNGGEFDNLFGRMAAFWSSTPLDTNLVWTRVLANAHDSLRRASQHAHYGFSVRCVRTR